MKKNYEEIDLNKFLKYILSCKKIIIIIIFTSNFLALAYNFSSPKFYQTSAIVNSTSQTIEFKFVNKNTQNLKNLNFYNLKDEIDEFNKIYNDYYLSVISQKNFKKYLNTINLNHENFKILNDLGNVHIYLKENTSIRIVTLESKNFKENLDDLLNKYLKYTEENIQKKYITILIDNYSSSLINLKYQLEVIRDLDLIDRDIKKFEIQHLINQIQFTENRINLLKSHSFFDSFIFQEASDVIPNNRNLLFLLLISFISSLLLSIFVISIRYILIK
jgi:LPS O-antigen subunit length determinant protein (WzzB/FepE family)